MLALDTEDDSKGDVKIINFYNGLVHNTFTGRNLRGDAWNYLVNVAPETVWATNTEYDLVNLFGARHLTNLCTLQYVSSGIMRGSCTFARIQFFDTLRHWPASVKQMGKHIGLKKFDKDFRSVKYCRRDTEITWHYTSEMLKRYKELSLKLKCTLPSMAMQLFRKFYQGDFYSFPTHIKKFFLKGYYGGRVEIYRMGPISESINHYDINSLYPSVMNDNVYPLLGSWRIVKSPDLSREGMFSGYVRVPKSNIPTLPVRKSEIIYPHGDLFGTWPYPEIRQLIKDGGQIIKTVFCVEFSETENPFESYIQFCYNKRLKSDNMIDNVFWKLMMNSLYGKFGSHRGITVLCRDKEFELSSHSSFTNIIWSAYVTSYARLRLLIYLRKCTEVYYTDTDSLFTPDTLPVSSKLGKLKLEGAYKEKVKPYAEFVGNKLYIIGNTVRAKGVPQDVAKDFIRTGRAIYRRPARFRESRRSFLDANVWYEVEKRSLKSYCKRYVLPDGKTTEAWDIGKYQDT